ncbi:MAG: PD-(D/E)XK nuclease family protein [Peptoniphilus sp.]|nr:PD-(D/E)XK nuclease family protein [Peptoniphilus sp.]
MKRVYRSGFYGENREIEEIVKERLSEGFEVCYVLPSKKACNRYIKDFLDREGAFSNLKFYTFDSLRYENINKTSVDNSFRKLFIKNKLREVDYAFLKENSMALITRFMRKAREDLIDLQYIPQEGFLKEVYSLYGDYLQFLKSNNLTDLLENFEINKAEKTLFVVDGFFSFKKLDFAYILDMAEKYDLLVNIPYHMKGLPLSENLTRKFELKGFEVVDNFGEGTFEDFCKEVSAKLYKVTSDDEFNKNSKLFKLLKYDPYHTDIVNFSKTQTNFYEHSKVENMEINGIHKRGVFLPLLKEFKSMIKYQLNQSRENLLDRLSSEYFSVADYREQAQQELKSMEFKNYEDLYDKTKVEVSLKKLEAVDFYELLLRLKVDLPSKGSFQHYSDYLAEILRNAKNYIDGFLDKKYLEEYRRDIKIYSDIEEILEFLKNYDKFFGEVTFSEYVEILYDYIDQVSVENKNNYAPTLFQLDDTISLKFENIILDNFDMNYPHLGGEDFIFNEDNKDVLLKWGFEILSTEEIYNRELLKVFKLFASSEKIYICAIENEESGLSTIADYFSATEIYPEEISSRTELAMDVMDYLKLGIYDENKMNLLDRWGGLKNIEYRIENENKRKFSQEIKIEKHAGRIFREVLIEKNFSVTDFDKYLKHPYYFLYDEILDIGQYYADEQDRYYMDLGNLYHEVLEIYFKNHPEEFDKEALFSIVDNYMSARDAFIGYEKLYRAKLNNIVDTLAEFIKMDLNNRNGFTPHEFEKKVDIQIQTLRIGGRIDRIDEFEGMKIITDYKRKRSDSATKIRAFESFQLPLYMSIVKNSVAARYGEIENGKYNVVLSDKYIVPAGRNSMSTEELQNFLGEVEIEIIKIYYRIEKGDFTTLENKDKTSIYYDMFREGMYL